MRYEIDEKTRTHCMMFDSIRDIVDSTEKNLDSKRHAKPMYSPDWLGRDLKCWDDIRAACFDPYDEGLRRVEDIVDTILRSGIPEPKSRKRRPRWDENDGDEICPDRWMRGDPYWTKAERDQKTGPSTVCLLTNLDAMGSEDADSVIWRGAGAVAIADVLENAGYNVDINIWCRGHGVYQSSNHGQFTSVNIKKPGDPLDIGNTMAVLTGWFTRAVIFGSFCTAKDRNPSFGSMERRLGSLSEFMALSSDRVIYMPIVRSEEGAVGAVKSVLTEFSDAADVEMSVEEWEDWAGVATEVV